MSVGEVTNKGQFAQMEEEVLEFWDKSKIFEKSVDRVAPKGDYVFYDGPPFATGTPHYGHIVASLMKDVVPRYWTMNGYKVERKWGWDCHGLPIENIAEKELGFKQKKEIIDFGIDKFNELCRSKVLSYVEEWEKVVRRLGRWADMKNSYRTMDLPYMESIWWVFKQLWDKELIYEGYRSIHVCPRCETTLSQQEVSEGYKDIKDLSAIAKFELIDEPGTFVLAWTTTPWTLMGNVALAMKHNIAYVKWLDEKSGNYYVTSKDYFEKYALENGIIAAQAYLDEKKAKVTNGFEYIGKSYKPLFSYLEKIINNGLTPRVIKKHNSNDGVESQFARNKDSYSDEEWARLMREQDKSFDEIQKFKDNAYKIYDADFVTTDEGTGVVHIAPAFGEDDLNLGKQYNLPFVQHVKMDGTFEEDVVYQNEELYNSLTANKNPWQGVSVKPSDDHTKTDIEIIKYLAHNGLLFHKEKYEHSYPHCWRCDTPLINYVTTSWFVNVLKIKDEALKNAETINWSPAHIKEGRFGNWLKGARDWSISRQRFWASVMPIWQCSHSAEALRDGGCGERIVFGSVKELEEASGQKVQDLHKHVVDKITVPCAKCGGVMHRVPDVLDTWFDSGSMPFAQMHYPFENKEKFEANFPAEFIAEGIDQTRAWFYYQHILGSAIRGKSAFKNVIVNGIVLAEDGKKMSKRLNNYPDPTYVFDRYGADAIRYYLASTGVVSAENLNFSEKGVEEALRKNNMILWNVYKFYEMYSSASSEQAPFINHSENVLDQWILAKLDELIAEVTKSMNAYDLPRSVRPIGDFINDLSTWYIRRSRDRFKSDDEADKSNALATTKQVLIELAKVMAPFMPFISENLWQKVTGYNFSEENQSVHLERWPLPKNMMSESLIILPKMDLVRKIVEAGLAQRDEKGIKIRQPLPYYSTEIMKAFEGDYIKNFVEEFGQIIKDELNILEVRFGVNELGTEMTEDLLNEGTKRELVRFINAMRKNAGLTIQDRAKIYWNIAEADFSAPRVKNVFDLLGNDIAKDVLADEIIAEHTMEVDLEKEVKVNGEMVWLGIKKVS